MPNLIDIHVTFLIDYALKQHIHHVYNAHNIEVLPKNFKTYFSVKCPKLQGQIKVEKTKEDHFSHLKGSV